jgi:transposase
MARAYSLDLRERLLRARDAGVAPVEIERSFGISRRTQRRWVAQQRATGSVVPRTGPGRPPKLAPAVQAALRRQVAAHADATLAEHCERLAAEQGVAVSVATMSRQLTRLELPLKKRRS